MTKKTEPKTKKKVTKKVAAKTKKVATKKVAKTKKRAPKIEAAETTAFGEKKRKVKNKRDSSRPPVRIYSYGCLPPIENAELLEAEMKKASRYENKLIEIERRRRQEQEEAIRNHSVLGPFVAEIDNARTEVHEARCAIRESRTGDVSVPQELHERLERAKVRLTAAYEAKTRAFKNWEDGAYGSGTDAATQEALATVRAIEDQLAHAPAAERPAIKKSLKAARSVFNLAKRNCASNDPLVLQQRAINERAAEAVRNARADKTVAPYWGTYLLVEREMDQMKKAPDPPEFRRYDGSGRMGVQFTTEMLVSEIVDGNDTQLQIGPGVLLPRRGGQTQARLRPEHRTVKIRAGSDPKRKPIWVTLPLIYDRPLPADGRVTWAWILRRLVGYRYKYFLQVTVESPSFVAPPHSGNAAVAIDLGARREPDGSYSIARWQNENGAAGRLAIVETRKTKKRSGRWPSESRTVPDDLFETLVAKRNKSDAIRSERDKRMRVLCHLLGVYRNSGSAPAWICDELQTVDRWRSFNRLTRFLRTWRRVRSTGIRIVIDRITHTSHEETGLPPGDAILFSYVEAWYAHDRHLSDFQMNQIGRALNRRTDRYHEFAAKLAKEYSTIILPARNLLKEELPPEKAPSSAGHELRKDHRSAAPGELREILCRMAHKYGAQIIETKINGDTSRAVDTNVCERMLIAGGITTNFTLPPNDGNAEPIEKDPAPPRRRRLGNRKVIDPLAGLDVMAPRAAR